MKQNYSIIKLFMLTIMAFFAGNAMADEAVFDFTTVDGLKAVGIAEANIPTVEASAGAGVAYDTNGPFTVSGVTISTTDGSTATRIWSPKGNDGTKYDFRVYGPNAKSEIPGGTMTITAPSGKKLSKIVFNTGTWNAPTASEGDLTAKEWNGNASSLTLSMEAGQCQFKTITVTFADAGSVVTKLPAGLSFSAESVEITLGETSFTAPTLTKATNADVKYSSTNTSIATVDETTGAVTITAEAAGTARIRATAEENDQYYGGQAEYQIVVKEAASGIANIAAMNALENGKEFKFDGKVTVVYESGSYVYIKDNTGSSLLYKSGLNVKKGDVIKAGWEGKVSIYRNLFEVVPSTTLETDGTAEVTYPEATEADVKAENMNQVVVLKGVTYGNISGKNFTIGSGIAGYNQYNITIATPEDGATYDIEGVISVYNTNVQFQPISITKVGGDTPEPPKPTACENIAACYDLASGTAVVLTLNNAKVLFTWTSNNGNTQTFVRDASGAIQFYNTGLNLNEGDVLNGEVQLTYSPYNGLPELIKNNDTDAGDFGVTAGDKAEPVEITEATAADYLNDLVTLKDFTPYLDSEKNRYYTSESKAVQLYNAFHLDGLDDAIAAIDTNKKYTVVGIMVKGQINVIEIEEAQSDVPGGDLGKAISYNEEPTVSNVTLEGMSNTGSENNCATWADGYSIMIMRSDKGISAGNNITVEGETYKTIKVSNGAQNTITAPDGKAIKSMTFFSYINIKASATKVRSSFWKEVDGVTYDGSDGFMKSCNTLVFDAGAIEGSEELVSTETPDKRSFELAEAKNKVTFTNTGEQLCYVLFVEEVEGTGINDVNAENIVINTPAYNLAGQKVGNNYKGIVIKNGRKYIK